MKVGSKGRSKPSLIIVLVLALGLGPAASVSAAASEDVALFYEALAALGQWLNYGNYGQVWRPHQVAAAWKPYTNGRWVPTEEGYVFETDEPWGWATYHYGNWLQTKEHGWVWVPGRTWYPNTVTWRTNDDYVGWTPVPPPEAGEPTGYQEGQFYPDDSSAPTRNYYPGSGLLSSWLSSPLSWIFVPASQFLLGWGQPYAPSYSYYGSGVLAPVQYYPVIYERTVYVNNYVVPSYARGGCYNWGPPVTYITRVVRIRPDDFERRLRHTEWHRLRHVLPPEELRHRHPVWRAVTVPVGRGARFYAEPLTDTRLVYRRLNHPQAMPAPPGLVKKGIPAPPGHLQQMERRQAVLGPPPLPPASRPDRRPVGREPARELWQRPDQADRDQGRWRSRQPEQPPVTSAEPARLGPPPRVPQAAAPGHRPSSEPPSPQLGAPPRAPHPRPSSEVSQPPATEPRGPQLRTREIRRPMSVPQPQGERPVAVPPSRVNPQQVELLRLPPTPASEPGRVQPQPRRERQRQPFQEQQQPPPSPVLRPSPPPAPARPQLAAPSRPVAPPQPSLSRPAPLPGPASSPPSSAPRKRQEENKP